MDHIRDKVFTRKKRELEKSLFREIKFESKF